jgi:hypothetical protein
MSIMILRHFNIIYMHGIRGQEGKQKADAKSHINYKQSLPLSNMMIKCECRPHPV